RVEVAAGFDVGGGVFFPNLLELVGDSLELRGGSLAKIGVFLSHLSEFCGGSLAEVVNSLVEVFEVLLQFVIHHDGSVPRRRDAAHPAGETPARLYEIVTQGCAFASSVLKPLKDRIVYCRRFPAAAFCAAPESWRCGRAA